MLERKTRLELATICLEGRNSNQLSYFRIWYAPIESDYLCQFIRLVLNTVEDRAHITSTVSPFKWHLTA